MVLFRDDMPYYHFGNISFSKKLSKEWDWAAAKPSITLSLYTIQYIYFDMYFAHTFANSSELLKTIGPVGKADENLSGPIVSSKTSVQITD